MWRRTSSRSVVTAWPPTRALPDVGLTSVQSMLMVVLLPAPLGPRKPNTSPGETAKDTPRTASTSPKDFLRSWTSMAAAAVAAWGGERGAMARHDIATVAISLLFL